MNNKNVTLFKKLKNNKSETKASIKRLGIQNLSSLEEDFLGEVSVNFLARLGGQIFQFYSLRGKEWSPGEEGVAGELGSKGLSPYATALSEGFVGTLENWKASLNGVVEVAENTLSLEETYLESLKPSL